MVEFYKQFSQRVDALRKMLNRPLTYAEKILAAHLVDPAKTSFKRGESYLLLNPDRVAMQDATAQMAILQFMQSGRDTVACPTTVHCDHLIIAREGAGPDLAKALEVNREVFEFLRSAAERYGMGFWKPGAGIIHQVILENYAFPGALMIGTDSHTPNAGGLGMIAVGVGGSDAAEVMAGLPWEVRCPRILGVHLTGELKGWASAKDVILKLCGLLTVKGATNKIVEYFGSGAESLSATGKATITNMGAEIGATASVFSYDANISRYLKATHREEIAKFADSHRDVLSADPEVIKDPAKYYDEVITIDLSTLTPCVAGPHTPDLVRPIAELALQSGKSKFPQKVTAALIGSCTNSSYEDLGRAAHIARQAREAGLKAKALFYISPGSRDIEETMRRDGYLADFEAIGGIILSNSCGPCIGQWMRKDVLPGEENSIFTSFNRNFKARNDTNPATAAFIASPEIVTAFALSGDLSFNPLKDPVIGPNDKKVFLAAPSAPDLPAKGFEKNKEGFIAPRPSPEERQAITVRISPESERLELLMPFAPWDGKNFFELPILIKTKGKCTTDHISPAGQWLKYRGHLNRISDNMLLGATNAFLNETGKTKNILTDKIGTPAEVARSYRSADLRWVVVGDENYGEGSSREHAAMSPRFLGCAAVLVKSFARIHETNLKKQGVLALTFKNPNDYEKIGEKDRVSIALAENGKPCFIPGKPLKVNIARADGGSFEIEALHSYSSEQIEWFRAGSALNCIKK